MQQRDEHFQHWTVYAVNDHGLCSLFKTIRAALQKRVDRELSPEEEEVEK